MIQMTDEFARAIATDTANAHMKQEGRKVWNRDDYNIACQRFHELHIKDKGVSKQAPRPTSGG